MLVVAALDGLVLEEDVVGGLVLSVLLPAGLPLVPETGLARLLTVDVALKPIFFMLQFTKTYEGVVEDEVDGGESEEDETGNTLPHISLLKGLWDGLIDVATVEGTLNKVLSRLTIIKKLTCSSAVNSPQSPDSRARRAWSSVPSRPNHAGRAGNGS